MDKVKILVVEDEIVIADNICNTLEKLGYEVMEVAINFNRAIAAIEEEMPDLVMLDIQLAGSKDGIDLAWKIKEDYKIPFIFLTSNADKATVDRAKQVDPPAYLVKPFVKDDLYTSIEMALHNFASRDDNDPAVREDLVIKDSLFVKDKHLFHKVRFADILFVKSAHVYVELYTVKGKTFLIRSSMTRFITRLPKNFFRVHRSYSINLDFLETINSMMVFVEGNEIPIGKDYRDELLARIAIE